MATLVRTDKNGTKYWVENKCPKCGGSGYLSCYGHVEGGVCFKCDGSGWFPHTWKEYTPEYAAKLADRRLAKARAKSDEVNKELFRKLGMNEDGKAWVVVGNTYEIKDQLKEAGAKYGVIGWHFDHEQNEYPCFELSIEQIAEKNVQWIWQLYQGGELDSILKKMRDANAPKSTSKYVGEVGQKLDIKVTFIGESQYETHFTYYGEIHSIYRFKDEDGNTIIWNTSSYQELEEGKQYSLKGTVKSHEEYKGDKQTYLNRCKIA